MNPHEVFHAEVQRSRKKRRRLDCLATTWMICIGLFSIAWVAVMVWVALHFAIKYW